MAFETCYECGLHRGDNVPKTFRPALCSACRKAKAQARNRAYKLAHGGYQKNLTCIDCGVHREGVGLGGRRGRCSPCQTTHIAAHRAANQKEWCKKSNAKHREKRRAAGRAAYASQIEAARERNRKYRKTLTFERKMLYAARDRAKDAGLPFDLTLEDIVVPETCPVFGMRLERSGGLRNPNLASIDRIEPSLGYVRGNVWIISWRANRLKCDASVDELVTLVDAIKRKVA